jgi:CBS domain-containing protein
MRCSELMKREVECCLEGSLVTEAAVAMRDHGIGFVPITSDDGVAIGTLTDRDIAVRVLAEGRAPDVTPVEEAMTREVIACSPDDELSVAEELMIRFQKSRIVCTDEARRIVGVISLSDVAELDEAGHAGAIAASVAMREAAIDVERTDEMIRNTRCRDVMNPRVQCSSRDDGVRKIASAMRDQNVGFLPVCDDDGAVIGTVTDRDLVIRVVAERLDPDAMRADDVLTPELIYCSTEDPLSVAENLMAKYKKSRILCADPKQRPIGVVSLSDIARVERAERVARLLRDVSARKPRAA